MRTEAFFILAKRTSFCYNVLDTYPKEGRGMKLSVVIPCYNEELNVAPLQEVCVKAFEGKYDKATIKKWLSTFMWRFFTQQFKRSCMPDGPRVGSCNLNAKSWTMPSDVSPKMFSDLCNRLETE